MSKTAIIGGTGVYNLEQKAVSKVIDTPYGKVEVDLKQFGDQEIVFLARHGKKHNVPPHLVNYRANIYALQELDVQYIFATNAVGSCRPEFKPGEVVLFTDFLDFTKTRSLSFYDGSESVIHVSMQDPYCQNLRASLKEKAQQEKLRIAGEAVYVCTEGPRFETAAEIKMYQQLGGDVVGMTGVPEVVLAKELGMCYLGVGIITNWCTGLSSEIGIEEIMDSVQKNKNNLTNLFVQIALKTTLSQEQCTCKDSLVKL